MTLGRKQKQKRDAGKNRPQKNKWTVFLFVWLFVATYWFLFAVGELPNAYISDWSREYGTVSNYSEFIEEHSLPSNLLANPFFVFCVGIAISIIIILMARRFWLIILLVPMFPCAFSFLGLMGLDWTTILYHVDTIEYEEYVYHLVYGKDGDMLDEKYLVLFTCDDGGQICSSRVILGYQYASRDSRFLIDDQINQLQVVSDNRIVFTLEDEG